MAVKRREGRFNPKRSLAPACAHGVDQLASWRKNARYGGNLEHKLHPADYGLGQPPNPRPGKTLCDGEKPLPKDVAVDMLRRGFGKGMVSGQIRGGWPQNVWMVDDADGVAYEAQLENAGVGAYHGYPMTADDPFRETVLQAWAERRPQC